MAVMAVGEREEAMAVAVMVAVVMAVEVREVAVWEVEMVVAAREVVARGAGMAVGTAGMLVDM